MKSVLHLLFLCHHELHLQIIASCLYPYLLVGIIGVLLTGLFTELATFVLASSFIMAVLTILLVGMLTVLLTGLFTASSSSSMSHCIYFLMCFIGQGVDRISFILFDIKTQFPLFIMSITVYVDSKNLVFNFPPFCSDLSAFPSE